MSFSRIEGTSQACLFPCPEMMARKGPGCSSKSPKEAYIFDYQKSAFGYIVIRVLFGQLVGSRGFHYEGGFTSPRVSCRFEHFQRSWLLLGVKRLR